MQRKQLKGVTFSATAPNAPSKGDIWQETNADGSNLYNFYWTWNGTYWLSPENSWQLSFEGKAASFAENFPFILTFNYLFTIQSCVLFADLANNSGNFWYLQAQKVGNASATNFTAAFNTIGLATNTWRNSGIQTHNQFVNPASENLQLIRIFLIKTGNAGNLWGGSELFYQLVRK